MENELMPCPVCGGYVDVGWDSDSQGQAVECSTDMNPWHYKVASGDVSKAVEAHNALARRAEIGALVERLVDGLGYLQMECEADANGEVGMYDVRSHDASAYTDTLLDALRALAKEVSGD